MEESRASIIINQNQSKEIEIQKGVRQGDALSALLFITSLDSIMKDVMKELQNIGTINNKSVQVIAYADDIAIIARNRKDLEQTLITIAEKAKEKGLEINEKKTKYMHCSRRKNKTMQGIKVNNYKFEEVETFKYLGFLLHRRNERAHIKQRIQQGYKAYYANKQMLKDKKLSKNTKLKIYKTTIRPVVTYAAEVANLTSKEEEQLKIFERKIVRMIMGPKKVNQNETRLLMNYEIENILKNENIIKIFKSMRIRWYGHIFRRDKNTPQRILTEWQPQNTRSKGRPKLKWKDQVESDLKRMKVTNWKQKIEDRKEWRKVVNEAKTHQDL